MLVDLTMIATLPASPAAIEQAQDLPAEASPDVDELQAQEVDVPHPTPGPPIEPEQPVVPPDDPHRKDVDREPSIDPPPIEPPLKAPSEKPGITEPPRPRA